MKKGNVAAPLSDQVNSRAQHERNTHLLYKLPYMCCFTLPFMNGFEN